MIFIIGQGRTGTNLLGKILAYNGLNVAFEEEPGFTLSVNFAVYQKAVFGSRLLRAYRELNADVVKNHTDIWHVKFLKKYYPKAKFLLTRRNVYSTVASGLQHEGVLKWVTKTWPENPLSGHVTNYDKLTIAQRLTTRWIQHRNRIDKLYFNPSVLTIDYENLVDYPETTVSFIANFLQRDLETPAFIEQRKRKPLTPQEIDEVNYALKLYN